LLLEAFIEWLINSKGCYEENLQNFFCCNLCPLHINLQAMN
jgi:hypothetical protein